MIPVTRTFTSLRCLLWLSCFPSLALAHDGETKTSVDGSGHSAPIAATEAANAPLDAIVQSRLDPDLRCLLGTYALPKRRWLTINGNNGEPRGLQFTLSSGVFGTLRETAKGQFSSDTFSLEFAPCEKGTAQWRHGTAIETATRVKLVEHVTRFKSDGNDLQGKLVLPEGGRAQALAVWIEGSNNNPSTDDSVWPYELAKRGVAVFVYDKRGTGASSGEPSSDFHARARDTAAALVQAQRLAPEVRRVGVIGGSQGGWVAPITAQLAKLDFMVAAFAMAEGPVAQDQAIVEQQVRAGGFGAIALDQARELTAITARIVRSNMAEGLDELDAFKARHAQAAWLQQIQPRSYTGIFLTVTSEQIKTNGPAMAQGLSFAFEPQPVIASIQPRQLWLLGGNDQQAPNAGTQAIVRDLQKQGRNLTMVVFPTAEHGLVESTQAKKGPSMRFSYPLFELTAAWIKEEPLPTNGSHRINP